LKQDKPGWPRVQPRKWLLGRGFKRGVAEGRRVRLAAAQEGS
jgi:hypothetical protein